MDKHVFKLLGLSAVAILIAVVVASCGSSSSSSKLSAAQVAGLTITGSTALTNGDPAGAKNAFGQILGSYPTDCTANWGMTLADVQDLTQNQLQTIVDFTNIETNVLGDNLGAFLAGISTDLTDITKRTPVIESQTPTCEFTLPILPVNVRMDPSGLITSLSSLGLPPTVTDLLSLLPTLNYQVEFGSQWGPAEARALGTTSNTLLAFVNILSAHSLDASALISLFMPGSGSNPLSNLSLSDPIGLVRGLGSIFNMAPTLLAFNNQGTGPADIKAAGSELAAALTELKGLNASLQLDAGNPNKVIAYTYTSTNTDGVVEAGDTFTVGCLYYTNSTWENLVQDLTGGETLTVPASISAGMVPSAETLMAGLISNLTTGSPNFVPMDVNPLLSAIGLAADSFVTNVISLNPHAIFANPVPLRNFLPTLATKSGDAGQFQIETEVSNGDPYELTSIGWYYTDTDSTHFTDGTNSIVADGISVPATASLLNIPLIGSIIGPTPPMIFYISFNDPTFNKSLSIDLSQMLGFCEAQGAPSGTLASACPAASTPNFKAATPYSLNKIIAGAMYGFFTDSTTGKKFTTTPDPAPINAAPPDW